MHGKEITHELRIEVNVFITCNQKLVVLKFMDAKGYFHGYRRSCCQGGLHSTF